MAKRLMERGLIPQLLLTSPATRALHTALIMSRIWELEPEALQIHDALYEADYREIEQVLNTAPAAVCDLAIFGHNPTFTLYANQFLEERLDNLPTAGVVVVTMESDSWEGIGKAIVTDTFVDYPKRKPKDLM
jgi:phosphohistidine phosphatase